MASQDMNISASRNEGFQGSGVLRHKRDRRWGVSVGAIAPGSTPIELGQLTMKRIKNATANEDTKKK